MSDQHNPGFCAFRGKGFHITFENGYTVSVQFGHGNYCARRYETETEDFKENPEAFYHWTSPDAEIAAWDKNGEWIRLEGWQDDVEGWQSPAQVLEIFNKIAELP